MTTIEVTRYRQDGVSYICAGDHTHGETEARAAAGTKLQPGERLADDAERVDGCWTWTVEEAHRKPFHSH